MDSFCTICKKYGHTGKSCPVILQLLQSTPKPTKHFSGKSAPEVFVGRIGYPHINSGILAPSENDNISNFSTAEEWSKNNFSIANVLRLRGQLIYGRGTSHIKAKSRLKDVSQELALSSKPTSVEVFLKKAPTVKLSSSNVFRPMTNPAPLKKALLEENPVVTKKVDYLTSDYDVKSVTALNELYKARTKVEHLQKLLSVGLLGVKASRRMVPTRWSITATDDIISKNLLRKVKYYSEINDILLFSGNFVGNYVEALVLPGTFSFEALEVWMQGNYYAGEENQISQDYEGFFGRKEYAHNVTGGYYAARLAAVEYLEKVGKQATILSFREIRPEYYAPLGVGVVRECTRRAFANKPQRFDSVDEALVDMQKRLRFKAEKLKEVSWILSNYGKQKSLRDFF